MSPAILFIILVVSILVFISGLVLLVMKLLKKQRLSSIFQSTSRHLDISNSNAFQRQLNQLFHVHDSGLDQTLIDVLPMFIYKDVAGLDGPFDCPVCLCEFSQEDKLRLLPLCKHAFHLNCIDTWLLSNSTCPLCRGTLFPPGFNFSIDFGLNDSSRNAAEGFTSNISKQPDEIVSSEKRVFSLRLGKFRHINEEGGAAAAGDNGNDNDNDIEMGESSNINLDGRRCFSMGSVQYVVADKEFQVALCPNRRANNNEDEDEDENEESKNEKVKGELVESGNNKNKKVISNDGKKISNGNKRESFSISKVWLWPKKSKIPDERDNQFSKPVNVVCLPTTSRECRCNKLDPKECCCGCSSGDFNRGKHEKIESSLVTLS